VVTLAVKVVVKTFERLQSTVIAVAEKVTAMLGVAPEPLRVIPAVLAAGALKFAFPELLSVKAVVVPLICKTKLPVVSAV
jgi:hypothetical protein